MKHSSLIVLAAVVVTGAIGWQASPILAQGLTQLSSGSVISNTTSDNALSITQRTDVGNGRSSSGALFLDNTGNRNTGLTLYSNRDESVAQPLMRMEVDNERWNEEILYIHSDSNSSRGLIRLDSPAPEIEFVETDQSGAEGKFELRVQHGIFQLNSRRPDDTTFEKKVGMTQSGDLELYGGAVNVQSGKASQFNGGINITGGCIAVDGTCLDLEGARSSNEPAAKSTPAPASTPAAPSSSGITLSAGAPRDLDCNSHTERGRMVLDHEQNRLYVCNGPERGWDHTDLSD